MGAYKQYTIAEQMERRSKKDKEIDDLKQRLHTYELLTERFGFCHSDMQVARLTKEEALKKYLEEMREMVSRSEWGGEPS